MRAYIPAIVVGAVFAGLLGAGFLGSSLFQSPAATFERKVDEKVEEAQRLLSEYEGGYPELMVALKALPPASQPAGDSSMEGGDDTLRQAAMNARQTREELSRRFAALGGKSEGISGDISSREQVEAAISANAALLDKAIQLVEEAASETAPADGGGEGSLAAASTLKATLLLHKADLSRRQAGVRRALAEREETNFSVVLTAWHEAHAKVATLEKHLAGVKGHVLTPGQPSAPSETPDATPKPQTKPRTAKPGARRGGLIRGLLDRLKPGGAKTTPEPAEPAEPEQPVETPAETTAEVAPAPTMEPIKIDDVPPIAERISQLQTQGQQVDGEIAEAQSEVDSLSGMIKGLKDRLAKAQADAQDAEKKMMALEDAGVTPNQPNALEEFTKQYNEQAKRHRDSTREAAALQHGVVRNARPDAEEENEILTAPLVPATEGAELKPELGIERLEEELRAAQGLVESRQQLRKLISARVEELQKQQQSVHDQLTKAKTWEAALAKQAVEIARRGTSESIQAGRHEDDAIEILTGSGASAAEQAASAARESTSYIQNYYSQRAPQSPSPQVGFLSGHAKCLAGDAKFGLALVYAQRAERLGVQARLLSDLAVMGIDAATLTPAGGEEAAPAGTPATQPQGIAQAIAEARAAALKATDEALEAYNAADSDLNRLWTVHTQIAAVHYLKAGLTTGDEAKQHQAAALREYELATRDRAEARAFRPTIERLQAAQQ